MSRPVTVTPSAPSGLLDTARALVVASTRTAVELTLQGPTIVRGIAGLAAAGARTTAEVSPLVVDALRAVPRLVSLLEQLLPVASGLQQTVTEIAPDLTRLSYAADALDRLAGAVDDLHRLARAVPSLERLASAVPALDRLGTATDDLATLATVVPALERLSAATDDLATLSSVVPALTRLAGATGELRTLAEAVGTVERVADGVPAVGALADAVPTVEALAGAVDDLHRLAAAAPALAEMAAAVDEVEKLTAAITHVETLARHAETTFPDVPPRLAHLDESLAAAAEELQKVSPDLRTLAGRIDGLDEQITTLADALAPLQGTTERVGRLVDKLPRRGRSSDG